MGSLVWLNALSNWQWALALAAPVGIFALYFLKLKRQPILAPSTFLWKKSIEDLRVNAFWQRLRRNILLLLQLLVAAFALLALLRPAANATVAGRRWIVMIDNSASMSATDVAPTRLDAAKAKALTFVNNLAEQDAAMVLAFNDSARVVASYTSNAATLRHAIASIRPTHRRTDFREALSIASGLANPQRVGDYGEERTLAGEAIQATVYLLSDGKFDAIDDRSLGNLDLEYVAIGASQRNVAILGLSARRSESSPDQLETLVRTRNYMDQPVAATIELLRDGQPLDARKIDLSAKEEVSTVFTTAAVDKGTISARIDVLDDFAMDDEAWIVVEPQQRRRVLVVGDRDVPLRAGLETDEVAKIASIQHAPASYANNDFATLPEAGDYDLIIFDRCSPPTAPPCNAMYIGATPPSLANENKTVLTNPIILNWNASHSLLRFLNLDDVIVTEAFSIPLPRGADALIESDGGALLFVVPRGVQTDLVQTFALVDDAGAWKTDWPLRLSFPLYILQVLRTFAGSDAEARQALQPGDAITWSAPDNVTRATLRTPSGRAETLSRSHRGPFEYLDADELGVYQATIGDATRSFAVDLFDANESSIAPAAEVRVGALTAKDHSATITSRREFWKPLALVAFVILLIEWHIYNRRVYI